MSLYSLRENGRIPMCWKCCHMVRQSETSDTMSGCTADPRIQDYEDAQNGCPLWLPMVKELLEKIEEAREGR